MTDHRVPQDAEGRRAELLFSASEIEERVRSLAEEIRDDFAGEDLVVVGVFMGAFLFLADLVRALRLPCEVDGIWLSSYEGGRSSSGRIRVCRDVEAKIEGRSVLVVEDIVDTGRTLRFLRDHLGRSEPRRLAAVALVDKKARREAEATVDYVGFMLEEGFLVGYGMDDDERHRALPAVYRMPGAPTGPDRDARDLET